MNKQEIIDTLELIRKMKKENKKTYFLEKAVLLMINKDINIYEDIEYIFDKDLITIDDMYKQLLEF